MRERRTPSPGVLRLRRLHRQRRSAARVLALASLALLGLGLAAALDPAPCLVWNASASASLGLFWVDRDRSPERGELVLAWPPQEARAFADARGYLPANVPLVKRVAAMAGDVVCANSGIVVINDRVVAETLVIDGKGRPLPAWNDCRMLQAGEVFLLMEGVPDSFDGRYFGPVTTAAIVGRLVPLWTW
jgi:conjugative transfer signal peptidase TraF